ncbi:MAG: DUF4330 family protein [Clostridia bacterium]|nr:DUF4330 family protein [Clostridia bacterium]
MTDKKFRLNIIDILILLVLAVAVAVLAYIFVFSDDTIIEGERHTVEYVVEVNSVNKDAFLNSIAEGDIITLEDNRNKYVGTVSKQPQILDCYKAGYSNEENKEVYTLAEDLIDLVITFTAEAEHDEWGYCISDSVYIPVNSSINLMIGDFRCTAFCVRNTVLD